MFAVIRTGGKQYRVEKGNILRIEKLEAQEGDAVEFSEVLLVGDGEKVKVGTPLVTGSKVKAKVKSQGKGKKIEVVKFKRRKNYHRNHGHRQLYTDVEITGITAGRAAPKKKAAAAEPAAE